MKKKFSILAFVLVTSSALADSGRIHCDFSKNAPIKSFSEIIPLDQNWSKSIESNDGDVVKFELTYSAALHTLEATIKDEALGLEASSGEWFREESRGATAVVKLSIKDRTYMLSCGLH